MKIKRIAGALGAEILDIDLAQPLPTVQVSDLRSAFLEHQVIFFRDQALTPKQFMEFARAMGEPVGYPFVKGLEG